MSKLGKWTLGIIGGGVLISILALYSGDLIGLIIGGIIFLIGIFIAKLFWGPG